MWPSAHWLGGNRVAPEQKVSFLICGAQKAGTTALAEYLRRHPRLFLPEQKELHHFDNETLDWSRGFRAERRTARQYHRSFMNAPPGRIWGEATPIYMYWETATERIWRYNPAMRIIVILRNPIERAYSHWAMEASRGAESLSFEEAIEKEIDRCRVALPQQHRVFSYQDRGFYSSQIRRLWRFFGQHAVLIVRQDELRSTPQTCLSRICMHLKVPPPVGVNGLEKHVGHYDQKMAPQTRERLRDVFTHEIQQLEAMLGWDCSSWLRG